MRYASRAVIVDVLADLGRIFDTEPLASVEIRRRRAARMLIRAFGRQPFRSMGTVSVIIESALFALGLPLVLL